jgi:hypothetical protein
MADALRMNICQRAKQLIYVKLDFQHGHRSFQLVEIPRCPIHCFGYVFENEVKIYFILLQRRGSVRRPFRWRQGGERIPSHHWSSRRLSALQCWDVGQSALFVVHGSRQERVSDIGKRSASRQRLHTLKRLSWRTRLIAASSPLGIIFV